MLADRQIRTEYIAGMTDPFHSTHWSVVLAAGGSGDAAQAALEKLCETYWYPLYAFARRRTLDGEEARDQTQAFFAYLLEKETLGRADPERGRFRAFLLTAFKRFLINTGHKDASLKRGGGHCTLSLDFAAGDERYRAEPLDTLTPERLFERQWVCTLLDQVLEQLRSEQAAAGKLDQFAALKGALAGESTAAENERAAERLGISPAATKQAAYRLRKRYRELFRAAVAETVADEAEVDAEIARLREILSEAG